MATWELSCSLQSGRRLLRSPPFLPGLGCQRDPSTGGAPVPQGAGNSGPRFATSSSLCTGRRPHVDAGARTSLHAPGFPVRLPTATALQPCAWAAVGPPGWPSLGCNPVWHSLLHGRSGGHTCPGSASSSGWRTEKGRPRLPQASASLSTGGPLTFRNHVPSSQTQGNRHHTPGWASATAGETATLCLTFVRNWDCQISSKVIAGGVSLCGSPETPNGRQHGHPWGRVSEPRCTVAVLGPGTTSLLRPAAP